MMDIELSIVMPCLNEEETIEICINKAQSFLTENGVVGEIVIGDNGSTDNSIEIAKSLGAIVVPVKERGYGAALQGGIAAAKGKYIIMGDSDDSYNFKRIMPFVDKLREGYDFVMGNRFTGGIEKGAMPFLHRYLGNPVLSFIGKLFFRIKVNDFHCGLRGFSKEAYEKMELKSKGMEFASEMVVKSSMLNLNMTEIPTTLSPDGRTRPPHLRTWRDGWRHLRFLLLYSPKWLFFIPGMLLIVGGTILALLINDDRFIIGDIKLGIHTLFYSLFFILIGFQFVFFFLFSKSYGVKKGYLRTDTVNTQFNKIFTLERGAIIGIVLLLFGIVQSFFSVYNWYELGFGDILELNILKRVISSIFFSLLGLQIIIYSFFYSILELE